MIAVGSTVGVVGSRVGFAVFDEGIRVGFTETTATDSDGLLEGVTEGKIVVFKVGVMVDGTEVGKVDGIIEGVTVGD